MKLEDVCLSYFSKYLQQSLKFLFKIVSYIRVINPWENIEKAWKIMGKMNKNTRKYGKAKNWEYMAKHRKTRESTKQPQYERMQ